MEGRRLISPSLSLELDQTQRLPAAFANDHGAVQAAGGLEIQPRGRCDRCRQAHGRPVSRGRHAKIARWQFSIRFGITLQQCTHLHFEIAQLVRCRSDIEGVDQFLQCRTLRGDILLAKHQQCTFQRMGTT